MGSINFQDFCYNISWLILALAILSHCLCHCIVVLETELGPQVQVRGHPFECFQAQLWVKLALVAVVRLGCVIIYFYRVAHGTVRHIDRWEGKHLSLALVTITLWSDAQSGIAELCQLIAPTFVFTSSNSIMWCTTSLFFY